MSSAPLSASSPVADFVVKNAVIFTSDDSLPFADSMAIRHRRILRVGTFSSIQDLIGNQTKELNLGGKVVVPGFVDSHGHLIYQGLQMMQVSFHGVTHRDELVRRIKEAERNVYQWADCSGKMIIRVCLFFPMETQSRLRPYEDSPHNCGLQVTEFESLLDMTMSSDKSELQAAIHAIGDKANDMVLDIYESVSFENGRRDRRFRIEHSQHLASGAPARFGKQGIVASMQPDHLLDDADSATLKLGMERAQRESFLFRSLLANNAQLAFGSDCPVSDTNPLSAVKTAMRRIPSGWESAWIPSECLTLAEALKAHTISGAHACFLDGEVGSLSPGKLADFVILSTDSWEKFAAGGSASIEATYVGGVQAYP